MFATKCPGQDMRYWTSDDIREVECPQCGETIEFFKTDIRLRCRNCKTRVGNPGFDMGCAAWCAQAEMCLGSGAKNLKKKPFKEALVDDFKKYSENSPERRSLLNDVIIYAEQKSRKEDVNMPAMLSALVGITMKKMGLIDSVKDYLMSVRRNDYIPEEAVNEAEKIVDRTVQANPGVMDKDKLNLEALKKVFDLVLEKHLEE